MDSVEQQQANNALPTQQQSVLIDGWLSPRMRQMLLLTAEREIQSNFNDAISIGCLSRSPKPNALAKGCDEYNGMDFNSSIDYIPLSVQLQRDLRGIFYNNFHDGYSYIFQAIATLLRRNQSPTVERIHDEIVYVHLYDDRKFQFYLDKGGRIEFALYAVIQITEKKYHTIILQDEIDIVEKRKLPVSPMDEHFDAARLICIEEGGGIAQERTGPFREVTYYKDGSGDDDDDDEYTDTDTDTDSDSDTDY